MKLYVTVEEFLYAKKIENQTERTLRGYKNALNLFANWLQKEWTIDELEKIRVIHLKQYVAYHLKMGHKATYVNGIIKILRAFFKYTNGEDYTDIAYEKVAWVREEKPVIKAFSAQDARQLLEYYDNKSYLSCRNRTIITMFLETGIRCKELIDMQPEDIKENYILIHGKNHKERLVPITSYLGKQLAKYRVRIEHQFELKSPDNNFFLSVKAKKLTNSAIERLIKIAGQGIQDARVSPHTFRHFYAQIQLKNGMDIYTLSRLLGHEKVSMELFSIYSQTLSGNGLAVLLIQVGSNCLDCLAVKSCLAVVGQPDFVTANFQIGGVPLGKRCLDFRFQLFLFSLRHLDKLGGFLVLLDHFQNLICGFHC